MLQTEISSPSQKTGPFASPGSLSTMFDSPLGPFTASASQNTDNLFTASTTNVPFEATHHLVHPASASAPIVPDFKRGVSLAQKRLSKRSRLLEGHTKSLFFSLILTRWYSHCVQSGGQDCASLGCSDGIAIG
jgi:hypothetical protein